MDTLSLMSWSFPSSQNIFQVITYLTPLLVVLTFSGRYTLLHLANVRAKREK